MTPVFQAQNPAISACKLGWSSCTCFAGAMAAAFDQGKTFVMGGCAVRSLTHDTSGGTTLAQIDAALLDGWNVNLNTSYRLPWADFAAAIDTGKAAVLQGYYAPIADSRFDAGRGFRGNHAIAVLPGWIAMDPLADGRATGVYKFKGEAYPQSLLRTFAGKLNIGGTGYDALGDGYVYASLTRDRQVTYRAHVPAGQRYSRYTVGLDRKGNRRITGHREFIPKTGLTVTCSKPIPVYRQTIDERIYLVKVSRPGSKELDGKWIAARYAREV